jgi:hypothetical protein
MTARSTWVFLLLVATGCSSDEAKFAEPPDGATGKEAGLVFDPNRCCTLCSGAATLQLVDVDGGRLCHWRLPAPQRDDDLGKHSLSVTVGGTSTSPPDAEDIIFCDQKNGYYVYQDDAGFTLTLCPNLCSEVQAAGERVQFTRGCQMICRPCN